MNGMMLVLIEHTVVVVANLVGIAVGIRSLRRKMDQHLNGNGNGRS